MKIACKYREKFFRLAREYGQPYAARSVYASRIPDQSAITIDPLDPSVDAAPVLQDAVDRTARRGGGVVLVASGTYVVRGAVHVWRGVRIIGYGPARPLFALPAGCPGFGGTGISVAAVIRDGIPSRDPVSGQAVFGDATALFHFRDAFDSPDAQRDACNTTFFSGLSNIDILVEKDNPAAWAIRFNVAQCSYLRHIACVLETDAAADPRGGAVLHAGGEIADCSFYGGAAGILTGRTSAGWQFLIRDCEFHRQRAAAVIVSYAMPCIVGCSFHSAPAAVAVPAGESDYVSFERCSFDAVERVAAFDNADGTATEIRIDAPTPPAAVRIVDPADFPVERWTNVHSLGIVGDGTTDIADLLEVQARLHPVLYFPRGRYALSRGVELPKGTVLLGLHPEACMFVLRDGAGGRAAVSTFPGDRTCISGIGIDAGANPGTAALLWRGGAESLFEDSWFGWGGHGDDPKGQGQGPSLDLAGRGTIRGVWSANITASRGLRISGHGPGRIELVSVEHHRDVEVEMRNAVGWVLVGLQTEENKGSENAVSLLLSHCRDLEFRNYIAYRTAAIGVPARRAAIMAECDAVEFHGARLFSWGPYPFEVLSDGNSLRGYSLAKEFG